jgi:hypothetical protein
LHGVDGTGEVSDKTVASRVEDPTAMRSDQAVRDNPVFGKGAKGADLIKPHETAVPLDIGGEDRRELSFDPMGFQGSIPPGSSIAGSEAISEGL